VWRQNVLKSVICKQLNGMLEITVGTVHSFFLKWEEAKLQLKYSHVCRTLFKGCCCC